MKNGEAAISSQRGSKKFENWRGDGGGGGNKKFRTAGVTFAGGAVPHYMPWIFQISHNCVTECTLQARLLLKLKSLIKS